MGRRHTQDSIATVMALMLVIVSSTVWAGSDSVHHMTITSPAFTNHGPIPVVYTCDGRSISPELNWSRVPDHTQSLALIVEDPDAPHTTWVHWVVYNLPADIDGLGRNIKPEQLPPSARQGLNSWHRTGYGGPCPPAGRHRYFFRLYALDTMLPNLHKPDADALRQAMSGHILEKARLVGLYKRQH